LVQRKLGQTCIPCHTVPKSKATPAMDRADIVHENFRARVAARDFPQGKAPDGPLAPAMAVALYRVACLSRALDRTSRAMQKAGQGFYTIGSSGHEGMAAVAAALRPTDMAFLHYRDAAFQIARADQVPGTSIAWDMLLSFAASSEDPISGGRHKVLGSRALMIPPQTSTIASHLPKAVGAAYSIGAAKRMRPEHAILPDDAIIMCSFGDASVNHSTAQGAFNSAGWTAYQGVPLPLLFVCEDNGIGISTKTPLGWIAANFQNRPGLAYFACDGLDIYDTFRVASQAVHFIRTRRKPAVLHIRTIRLYGHAGADVPTTYLPRAEVEAEEAQDPLLHSVRLLHAAGALDPAQALTIYDETQTRVARIADQAITRPRLKTATDVMASIIPQHRDNRPTNGPAPDARAAAFGADLKAMDDPQPMSRIINWALTDLMLAHPEIVMMGEDGWCLRRHAKADHAVRRTPDDRHAAGRAIHPWPCHRHGAERFRADARDSVSGLSAQRRGSVARRGGDLAVLFAGSVHQPDGAAHRGLGLSKGLWRAFPQ
jgi:2-oxoisovalerate dehydrogenase E1 component